MNIVYLSLGCLLIGLSIGLFAGGILETICLFQEGSKKELIKTINNMYDVNKEDKGVVL